MNSMNKDPLLKLESLGQSVWLDSLGRHSITSGDLKRLIDGDGLSGVTSNPSIFEKANVEPLVGPHTINTMPLETLEAYRDQGQPEVRLPNGLAKTQTTLIRLAETARETTLNTGGVNDLG